VETGTQGNAYNPPPRFGRGGRERPGRFGWNRQNSAAPAAPSDAQAAGPVMQKTWNTPGFGQNVTHPVVCISWNDAKAYADWLGRRTGHRYRLPSKREWQMAIAGGISSGGGSSTGTVSVNAGAPNALGLYGLDGNVSEWLEDCAFGCERHEVAGRSWRDRGTDQIPTGRMGDRGFDDVGFRVVEILDGRN